MDIKEALRILSIEQEYDKTKLKKKYRELMRLVHPDNGMTAHEQYEYSAQEINEAYSLLFSLQNAYKPAHNEDNKRDSDSQKEWHAKINERALFSRSIYDEVHDMDGNIIGFIEVAHNKYMWTIEEEFHLFLKSIFTLSKKLLDDIDKKLDRSTRGELIKYQAELTYLLAGQYIDSVGALYALNLDIENEDEDVIFYVPAMLEVEGAVGYKDGIIYPAGVRNHRLYVCDKDGKSLGYLSFKDDRYAFIVTPLFEQKSVQIKMRLEGTKDLRKKSTKNYKNVDLWIKVPNRQNMTYVDSIGLKVAELLNRYEND